MKNTAFYKGKKIVVVGLARSGLASANLLYNLGAEVSVTDNKDSDTTRLNASKLRLKKIKIELGRHSQNFIRDKDLLVISPGVANDAAPVEWAKEFKLPIISEIELAWDLCPATVIAVTGSNGKTTVTTLIGRILETRKNSGSVFVCGNIGNPFSGELEKIKQNDFVSLEVSSFQLEYIKNFKPKVSVILNFTINHLDRYKNLHEYFEAKKRIFMNQDSFDYLVLNYDDPVLRPLAEETSARVVFFSAEKNIKSNEDIVFGPNPNQAAIFAIGEIFGIDKKRITEIIAGFTGLRHRMELVATINDIKFINDSKATTADSTVWALKNINEPIILIAGGKDKGVDYSIILELARKKVKQAIIIGESKDKIRASFRGALSVEDAGTLKDAVHKAYSKAKAGDCILLSPMCSSFDMFSSYEERGDIFREIVFNLAKEKERVTDG